MSMSLTHSMFQDVLFPPQKEKDDVGETLLSLRRLKRFTLAPTHNLRQLPLVVFDLETTGLDFASDRIIEIGAIKLLNFEPIEEFSFLVKTDVPLTDDIVRLTGISPDMLEGQPEIQEVLPKFQKFIEGSVLVAHNAEFDLGMLKAANHRLGIDLEWPCFCTIKLSRELLPDLENRKLDTLASHYGLTFEARHRSIGDVKVTCGALKGMMTAEGQHLQYWSQFANFTV